MTMTTTTSTLCVALVVIFSVITSVRGAGSMTKAEIAVQSSKYEKYEVFLMDIQDNRVGYTEYISNHTNAEYCSSMIPGDTDVCNETLFREQECNCTNPSDDGTCQGECDADFFPWCEPQYESSAWYPVMCDGYSNQFHPMSVCGPYDENETNPGEPWASYGIQSCATGGSHQLGPEPEDDPDDRVCVPFNESRLDSFADWDFRSLTYESSLGEIKNYQSSGSALMGEIDNRYDDSDWKMMFGANVLGRLTVNPGICFSIMHSAFNNGNLVINGSTSTDHIMIVNTNNTAAPPYALQFLGGHVYMFGGTSTGTAPITFSTDGSVHVSGLDNYGEVDFTVSQNIWLSKTRNHVGSTVRFTGVVVNGFDVTNEGSIVVENGNYTLLQAENQGSITVNGANTWVDIEASSNSGDIVLNDGTFDVVAQSNSGTVTVNAGHVNGVLIENSGVITIASGVTGTAEILGTNTGTITNNADPSDFTLVETSFYEDKLAQSITFTGLCTEEVDAATSDVIREEIAEFLGIESYLLYVRSVTGDSCSTRRRARRMLTADSVTIEYEVYLTDVNQQSTIESSMSTISSQAGGLIVTSIGEAIGSSAGTITLSSASASSTEEFTGYGPGSSSPTPTPSNDDDDDDDDSFPTWAIAAAAVGGLVVVVVAVFIGFTVFKHKK